MPLKGASAQAEFTVSGIACPEGSECMDAMKCVEMGGRCIEGTAGCGGRAQNCCCTFRKPVVETALPVLMAVGAMVLLAVGIAYELWKLGRPRR
jgi:hypothetical protein